MNKQVLHIEGMTCTNCAKSVSKYLESTGNEEVFVDYIGKEASFTKAENSELKEIIDGINNLGYQVIDENETSPLKQGLLDRLFESISFKLIVSTVFTLPLLLPMFFNIPFLKNDYVQLGLCLPVFIIGMYHFGKSGYYGLKTGILNMDVLITIGSLSAFVYSFYGTYFRLGENFQFYETSATIITLVLIGNFIERMAVNKTTTAVSSLYKLQPKTFNKVINYQKEDQSFVKVNLEDARLDDIFVLKSGDRVPLDAVILEGNGSVNEASLTGESFPVEKNKGEDIFSGTLLINGNITAMVNATAKDSVFGKIIALVKNAQQDKPEMQKLADKVSNYFVPLVLILSVVSFLLNYFILNNGLQQSMLNSIAVLVVSCPCALGLATPTAVVVGLGKAAKNGILIKGASLLQKFATVKKVVFDKTGTLTSGSFKVKKINPVNTSAYKLKSAIKGLEQFSNHPIAVSIVEELEKSNATKFEDVKELTGLGIMGKTDNGDVYSLGSYNLARHLTNESEHTFYVVKNDELIGTIDMYDFEKPNADVLVDYFNQQNIETVLLSGDNEKRCSEMADKLNISSYYSETLPEEKLQFIEDWQKDGSGIAMLGDGINDAPALTKANVGVAFAKGTNIAMDAAEMVVMKEDLKNIVKAHKIAKHTYKTIKQNIFWAFAYNIVAIPLAMFGFLSPMLAAFTMALSDFVVVGNSVRFMFKKID